MSRLLNDAPTGVIGCLQRVTHTLGSGSRGQRSDQDLEITRPRSASNSRVHLPGGPVTALARKPMKMNHHLVAPGPRRTSPAGDANVRFSFGYPYA